MPEPTTAGRLLVNEELPEGLRDYARTLKGDDLNKLLEQIAHEYPDDYKRISHRLLRMGADAAYRSGSTIRLSDFDDVDPEFKKQTIDFIRKQEAAINASDATPEEKDAARTDLYQKMHGTLVKNTMAKGANRGNNIVDQVVAKARGNPAQVTAMLTTPGVYADAKGRTIPLFIEHSYAQGLTPAEYYAATYGARTGVIATKFATMDAGDLGKQITQATNTLMVTEEDCGTERGIPVPGGDMDNYGAVLAQGKGGFNRGEIINSKMIRKFGDKEDDILVRSPITCQSNRGVCAKCVGVREKGRLPEVGSSVGISAASALAERIAQGSLNCLDAQTEVLMADLTTRPICTLKRGDKVIGSDLNANTFVTTVTDVWDQGMQPTYEYIYEDGRRVISTEIHPILQLENGEPSLRPVGDKRPAILAETFTGRHNRKIPCARELGEAFGTIIMDGESIANKMPTDMWSWSIGAVGEFISGIIQIAGHARGNTKRPDTLCIPTRSKEFATEVNFILNHLLCVSASVKSCPYDEYKMDDVLQITVTGDYDLLRLFEYVQCNNPDLDVLKANLPSKPVTEVRSLPMINHESAGVRSVWDISVEHEDSLFVLANGLIVKNTKHTGGQKSTDPDAQFQGFTYINQFAQIPKHFRDGSTLAEVHGTVNIKEAPQGGWYVHVGDEEHYVEPDRELLVKDGDIVEAGDQLSNGLINPSDVTRLKGIGEGRRYYADRFTKLYRASGLKVNRRNVELAARGAVDQVKIDDPDGMGDYLPDDDVPYSALERSYKPREDSQRMDPKAAVGRFLEEPVLHYSIGTPITSSVVKRLNDFDVKEINTHQRKPAFRPNMQRLRTASSIKGNWLGKQQGSYLTKNLLEDLHFGGAGSDIHGTDPVPAIIYGKELGQHRPGETGY